MTAPAVSVIIIFLNGERYIAEAIESVIAQTFADWELILVDDGTTDGATAIAQGYAARMPGQIRYTEHEGHENRGMSASRNRGISLARGRYVAFLDADDVYRPERLAHHVALLEADPALGMVYGPMLLWRSWAPAPPVPWLSLPPEGDRVHPVGFPNGTRLAPPMLAIAYLERRGGIIPGICSVTARRSAVLACGGFEDSFRTLYEDQIFFFRMAMTQEILVITEVLDWYRQHPDSACSSEGGSAGDLRARPRFLDWLESEIARIGIDDPALERALASEQDRFSRPIRYWWRVLPDRLGMMKHHVKLGLRRLWIRLLTPALYLRLRRAMGNPDPHIGQLYPD